MYRKEGEREQPKLFIHSLFCGFIGNVMFFVPLPILESNTPIPSGKGIAVYAVDTHVDGPSYYLIPDLLSCGDGRDVLFES